MIKRGMAANRVNSPINIKMPQIISNVPVKGAQKNGLLNPIFAKRPAPAESGNKYFCMPSERNISPTAKRHKSVGMLEVVIILRMIYETVFYTNPYTKIIQQIQKWIIKMEDDTL